MPPSGPAKAFLGTTSPYLWQCLHNFEYGDPVTKLSDEAKAALDLRLAKGEVSMGEYLQIKNVIEGQRASVPTKTANSTQALGEYKGFKVFPEYWEYDDDRIQIADIASVAVGRSKFSINGLPSVNHSYVCVTLVSGRTVNFEERKTYFGERQHQYLLSFGKAPREVSYKIRLQRLWARLAQEGGVQIGMRIKKLSQICFLTCDGRLTCDTISLDLKKCKADGQLHLGTYSLNSQSGSEIYASYSTIPLRKPPFTVSLAVTTSLDTDIAFATVDWLSRPDNVIRSPRE